MCNWDMKIHMETGWLEQDVSGKLGFMWETSCYTDVAEDFAASINCKLYRQ